jgi:hypothetical protein
MAKYLPPQRLGECATLISPSRRLFQSYHYVSDPVIDVCRAILAASPSTRSQAECVLAVAPVEGRLLEAQRGLEDEQVQVLK